MHRIRPALGNEAPALGDLAIRSKAYWGYDDRDMDIFRNELTISTSDCDHDLVGVIEENDQILGFYKLIDQHPVGELDFLFVEPQHIGSGLGKDLFNHAISHAGALGISALDIVSDPNAMGFYEHMGAQLVDYRKSQSIQDRLLPVLRIEIEGS